MARLATKCGQCGDIIWFGNADPIGQSVVCPCGLTTLTEDGPEGACTDCTQEELDGLN
jgi:DNA-directed RNA polymerase subunit RPC12/RpoP